MTNVWGILLRICELPIVFYKRFILPLIDLIDKVLLEVKWAYIGFLAAIERRYILYRIEHEVENEIRPKYTFVNEMEKELLKRGARELLFRSSDIEDGVGWAETILEYKDKHVLLYSKVITVEIIREFISWWPKDEQEINDHP